MLTTLIILVSIALLSILGYDLLGIRQEKEEARKQEKKRKAAEIEAQYEAENQRKQEEYKREYYALTEKYGEATTTVLIGLDRRVIADQIFVFEKSSVIYLYGEIIPFDKIIGYSVNDSSETIMHNEATYRSVTKTDTANMIGRAAIGGLILGSAGALAGASTAKKETITTPEVNKTTSTTKHNYIIYVNIDDLSNPIREIKLGSNTNKAQTIANIFNIIIQRKNK